MQEERSAGKPNLTSICHGCLFFSSLRSTAYAIMLVSKKTSSLMKLIAVPVLRPPEVDPALQVSQGGRHGAALLLLSGPLFHGFSQGPPQVALLLPVGRRRYLPNSLLHVGPYAHRDDLRSHEFYLQSSLFKSSSI